MLDRRVSRKDFIRLCFVALAGFVLTYSWVSVFFSQKTSKTNHEYGASGYGYSSF